MIVLEKETQCYPSFREVVGVESLRVGCHSTFFFFLALCTIGLCSNYSLCCCSAEAATDNGNKLMGMDLARSNFIYNERQLAGFGPWAKFANPYFRRNRYQREVLSPVLSLLLL